MKRLTEVEVQEILHEHGCELLSSGYKNNKSLITILCKCGHERITKFDYWKRCKQYLCKECTKNNGKNYGGANERRMNWKTEKAVRKKMERLWQNMKKYRTDFLPENYDKTINCRCCKRDKRLFLFSNQPVNTNGKQSYCKTCNLLHGTQRRKKRTSTQFIKKLLNSCRSSTNRRIKRNRGNMGFSLSICDIENLIVSQKNKCVYSGKELAWKSNHLNTVSIDRIDSNQGYIPSNIQLVTKTVNAMKSNLTEAEFLDLITCCYQTQTKKEKEKKANTVN